MQKHFLFFLLLFFQNSIQAQDVILNSQAEVDAFDSSITTISGNLTIEGNDIVDLSNLSNLQTINEDLVIKYNSILQKIDGLEDIITVGGILYVSNNDSLQNLNGLENLQTVESIHILENETLQNIKGLSNLNSAEDYIQIIENSALQNIDGLENLQTVDLVLIEDNSALQNLDGFSNLNTIGDRLVIYDNIALQNLDGFQNLHTINGYLMILGNEALQTINGFQNLNTVRDYLVISSNDALQTINGFQNLNDIGEYLAIAYHDSLQTINGFQNLNSIGDRFTITGNESLQKMDGFQNLNDIGAYVSISSNDNLLNLGALQNITKITESLILLNNSALQNLDALQNLTTIVGSLRIDGNSSLQNLDGLSNITSITDFLAIYDNNNLTDCCGIQPLLLSPDAIGGEISIFNNPAICSSSDEIIMNCENLSSAKGCMYWDENQNGIKDSNEKSLPTISSISLPNDIISFTDTAGCFTHLLNNGDYVVTHIPSPYWQLTSDSIAYNITINDNHLSGLDFGFFPTDTILAGKHHVASGITRCFREVEFDFNFRNEGTTILNGKLAVELDAYTEVTYFIHPVDSILNELQWEWHFEDLYPGQLLQRTAILQMPAVNDTDSIFIFSSVTAQNDFQPENSFKNFFETPVLCAYDPNDKLVSPDRVGDENYTLFDEDLFYTIRFQNTGNDTAFTVVIRDTLDENLNASSFRIMASSHQEILHTEIVESRYITFTFDNIMLPDSTIDFNGSQGYVTYTIQPNEGLEENTRIENTASIYFDFNPPIITNTTQNTMVSCLPIEEMIVEATINEGETYTLPDGMIVSTSGTYICEFLDEEGCPIEIIITNLNVLTSTRNLPWDQYVRLSPNPTGNQFNLTIQTNEAINHQLILTNIYGQVVFSKSIQESQTKVDVQALSSGIYWAQIHSKANELLTVQKLIITN